MPFSIKAVSLDKSRHADTCATSNMPMHSISRKVLAFPPTHHRHLVGLVAAFHVPHKDALSLCTSQPHGDGAGHRGQVLALQTGSCHHLCTRKVRYSMQQSKKALGSAAGGLMIMVTQIMDAQGRKQVIRA